MDEVKESERKVEVLRAENEELDQELSKAQKKKAIKEAKAFYGDDLKKVVGGVVKGISKLRVNSEAMHNLHSLGVGGNDLKDLNNPRTWRK